MKFNERMCIIDFLIAYLEKKVQTTLQGTSGTLFMKKCVDRSFFQAGGNVANRG